MAARGRSGTVRSSSSRGYTLVELLVALFILGLLFALGIPALADLTAHMTLRAACFDVTTTFRDAQARAIFQGRDVGVKWIAVAGDLVFAVYEDGNGNGVRTEDIRKGVDRRVSGPFSMKAHFPGVSFSFVKDFTGKDPGGAPVGNLADPIHFGHGDICTFSPMGHASPGTVYLSDAKGRQACVRVSPYSSSFNVYEWDRAKKKWRKTS